jgi:hypothetical protein
VQHAVVRLPRVADRDQHRVREQEVQRPRPEAAVPGHEAVLADRALERRHARHEEHHDDHRVGGEQTGEPPERRRDAAGRAQRSGALRRDREADRDAEPDARRCGQHVDDHRPLARGAAPGRGGGERRGGRGVRGGGVVLPQRGRVPCGSRGRGGLGPSSWQHVRGHGSTVGGAARNRLGGS